MDTNASFDATHPHNLIGLPPSFNFKDSVFMDLLIKARAELGELKGYSSRIPNDLLLLSPAIIKESVASSEIENINTTVLNVLENQLIPESEQTSENKEVLRYRDSVIEGFRKLQQFSLSTRTIVSIHDKLMPQETSGYRTTQNGIQNTATRQVVYTPPAPGNISSLISNLENYMNITNDDVDPLIKAAVGHYQFEAIHPFTDGNGRTGRILMVEALVKAKILDFPVLYISGYINENKQEYYRLLLGVTKDGNWNDYILFMLKGFYLQAKETKELLLKIMNEYEILKNYLKEKHKNIDSSLLAEALYSFPIITASKLSDYSKCHRVTAAKHLTMLAKEGILDDKKIGKYHFYANKKLVEILNG